MLCREIVYFAFNINHKLTIQMKLIRHSEYIYSIENFWSVSKCNEFIQRSESIGYQEALIQTDFGQKRLEQVRNNQRVLFTDNDLAHEIWGELKHYCPASIGNSEVVGLNELFRFYKYQKGQMFKKHRDQSFIRNERESSYYTLLIYLNDDFEGGATSFNLLELTPKKGTALVFLHNLEHEGKVLISGTKYVLRTDIMYVLKDNDV